MEVLEILRDMGIGAGRRIQGTATPSQVRAGATFMSTGNLVGPQTGTLTVQATGPQTVTPGTADIVKAAGIYDGAITVAGDVDLTSANVKAGVTIFGVTGSANVFDTTEATNPIAAATVLAPKVGFVNGVKVTGTMTNVGAQAITPGTAAQTITAGYHNGSGSVAGDADLVSANIKAGINIFGVAGKTEVIDTTDAVNPATAADLLASHIAFVNGVKLTGTMTDRGAVAITPGTAAQTITAGYHNGSGSVAGDADLISANIKAGINIFGVAGATNVVDTTEATVPIAAATVLSGKKGFVNGALVTGTITDRGAGNNVAAASSSNSSGQVFLTPPSGNHFSGGGVYLNDANFVPANIKAGVNVLGITGTLPDGSAMKKYAYGTATAVQRVVTITGLTFTPAYIIIETDDGTNNERLTYFANAFNRYSTNSETLANKGTFLSSNASGVGVTYGTWSINASGFTATFTQTWNGNARYYATN